MRKPSVSRTARRALKELALHQRVNAIGAQLAPDQRPRGKYHAARTVYKGVTYDSAGEAEYAWKLDQRLAAGEIKDWFRPKPITLIGADRARDRVTYRPDFYVVPREGSAYYVDYKGSRVTETAVFKLKVKLWKQNVRSELRVAYPDGTEKVVATGVLTA